MNYVTSARIVSKRFILDDVIELILEPNINVKYKPGSFVQLTLGEVSASEIWPDSRTFSIADYNFNQLRFLIQKKGYYTAKIIDETKVDDFLTIKYPFGNMFNLKNIDSKNVFLAGGLGITPFLSLTEFFFQKQKYFNLELFYSAKSLQRLIYIDYFRSIIPNIKIFTTQEESNYINRRISRQDLFNKNYSKDTHFYICGNPSFIVDMQNILSGLNLSNVHVDEWE